MPPKPCPALVKKIAASLSLASLGVLTTPPTVAQMQVNTRGVNQLLADNTQTQQRFQTAPGINLVAQVGVRNLADELEIANDAFSTLSAAINAAGLSSALARGGPYTIFAPTDEAFNQLPSGTVKTLLEPRNRSRLTQILTYHVVPGNITTFGLRPGSVLRLRTLQGQPLTVRVTNASEVYVNGNKVIMADIPARNGTIHGISSVLIP